MSELSDIFLNTRNPDEEVSLTHAWLNVSFSAGEVVW